MLCSRLLAQFSDKSSLLKAFPKFIALFASLVGPNSYLSNGKSKTFDICLHQISVLRGNGCWFLFSFLSVLARALFFPLPPPHTFLFFFVAGVISEDTWYIQALINGKKYCLVLTARLSKCSMFVLQNYIFYSQCIREVPAGKLFLNNVSNNIRVHVCYLNNRTNKKYMIMF